LQNYNDYLTIKPQIYKKANFHIKIVKRNCWKDNAITQTEELASVPSNVE